MEQLTVGYMMNNTSQVLSIHTASKITEKLYEEGINREIQPIKSLYSGDKEGSSYVRKVSSEKSTTIENSKFSSLRF